MIASVVICADGSDRNLKHALRALAGLRPAHAEIIVVDGGSDSACRDMMCSLTIPRLRHIAEPFESLAAARNLGAAEAYGAIVAFLDADATPQDGWLEEHVAVHHEFDDAATVCGRVMPVRTENEDAKLHDRCSAYFSAFDCGDVKRPMSPTECSSGNLSYKRACFLAAGGFQTSADRATSATSRLSATEAALNRRLAAAGRSVIYAPNAVVMLPATSEHLGNDAVRRRVVWDTISDALSPEADASLFEDGSHLRPWLLSTLWRLFRLYRKRRLPLAPAELLELRRHIRSLLMFGTP